MKTYTYTIKDKLGVHARPAGLIAKLAKGFSSEITIERNGKSVNATKLMMLMGLGIKCGDTIKVSVNGDDEDIAAKTLEEFMSANL